jgi:hypothetical protein
VVLNFSETTAWHWVRILFFTLLCIQTCTFHMASQALGIKQHVSIHCLIFTPLTLHILSVILCIWEVFSLNLNWVTGYPIGLQRYSCLSTQMARECLQTVNGNLLSNLSTQHSCSFSILISCYITFAVETMSLYNLQISNS